MIRKVEKTLPYPNEISTAGVIAMNLIAGILKNFLNNKEVELNNNSMKLPEHFLAVVKKIQNEFALIEWKGKIIPVKLEVPVKEGELLLLQLKKESEDKQFYRILARSPAEIKDSEAVSWQVMLNLREKITPFLLKVNYYQYKKRDFPDEQKGPSLEVGIQTRNLGFVVLRVSSLTKPYHCRFLVTEREKGELLEKGLPELTEHLKKKGIPVKILPYKVVLPAEIDEIKLSSLIDKRA